MTWFINIIKVCYTVIKFHDVRCRDVGSEERTKRRSWMWRKLDEWMSPSWTELGMNELEGQLKWTKYLKSAGKYKLKWYGHVLRREEE